MNSANHIVMRQIMELETPSREAAFGLQQRIGAWCRNVLPALLDQICTRCDGGDRVFRIDRLEIDLGRVSALHLEEEIGPRIATMLYEALREKVDQLRLPEDSGAAAGRPQLSIRGSPKISTAIFGDRMLSPVEADLDLILYFLDTGSLPWSTVAGIVAPLEEKLKKLMETAPDQIDAILKFVASRPVARRRLISMVPPPSSCGRAFGTVPSNMQPSCPKKVLQQLPFGNKRFLRPPNEAALGPKKLSPP